MTRPTKSPMLSKGRAKRCEAILRSVMAPGERLIALADVTSVTPLSIGLAATAHRLIAVPTQPAHPARVLWVFFLGEQRKLTLPLGEPGGARQTHPTREIPRRGARLHGKGNHFSGA